MASKGFCMVLCGIAWYSVVLYTIPHNTTCMLFHSILWHCRVLYGVVVCVSTRPIKSALQSSELDGTKHNNKLQLFTDKGGVIYKIQNKFSELKVERKILHPVSYRCSAVVHIISILARITSWCILDLFLLMFPVVVNASSAMVDFVELCWSHSSFTRIASTILTTHVIVIPQKVRSLRIILSITVQNKHYWHNTIEIHQRVRWHCLVNFITL